MRLYTYLPKENTAGTDGLLSTVLSKDGYKKYRGRTGKFTKEDVLRVLDSWEPDWRRSKAISALAEPIPDTARPDLVDFAKERRLYSFDTKDLVKARILAAIRATNRGRGTHPADLDNVEKIDWKKRKKNVKLRFAGIPHFMVETKDGKIPKELVREEGKQMSFPKEEHASLKGKDRIFTTRVSDDFRRYAKGDTVRTPWGDRYEVEDRKDFKELKDHPYLSELTEEQKKMIGKYRNIAGLWLRKINEKTAGAKIDIQKLYDVVKKRYSDLGYDISGDRLLVSEQPMYANGKPVPRDVLKPNVSGGDTQDDGTIRINPNYRSVMRHWKLKGSGRDFLNTIIGHELGHHIDRTLLRGTAGSKQELRDRLLNEIRRRRFHTVYTDSYDKATTDPRKLDKELLAEYLSSMVNNKTNEKKAEARENLVKVAADYVLAKRRMSKQAANVGRLFLRAGADGTKALTGRQAKKWMRRGFAPLSDASTARIRQSGTVPTPEAYMEGYQKGTSNILNKSNGLWIGIPEEKAISSSILPTSRPIVLAPKLKQFDPTPQRFTNARIARHEAYEASMHKSVPGYSKVRNLVGTSHAPGVLPLERRDFYALKNQTGLFPGVPWEGMLRVPGKNSPNYLFRSPMEVTRGNRSVKQDVRLFRDALSQYDRMLNANAGYFREAALNNIRSSSITPSLLLKPKNLIDRLAMNHGMRGISKRQSFGGDLGLFQNAAIKNLTSERFAPNHYLTGLPLEEYRRKNDLSAIFTRSGPSPIPPAPRANPLPSPLKNYLIQLKLRPLRSSKDPLEALRGMHAKNAKTLQ